MTPKSKLIGTFVLSTAFGFAAGSAATYMLMPESKTILLKSLHDMEKNETFSVTVQSVHDGDTIKVRYADRNYNIRIWGIDTPELKQTCTKGRATVPCGEMARDALSRLVANKTLSCVFKGEDRNRIVALCHAAEVNISSAMLRQGMAKEYAVYTKGLFSSDEAYARDNKFGIWGMTMDDPRKFRDCQRKTGRPADCPVPQS